MSSSLTARIQFMVNKISPSSSTLPSSPAIRRAQKRVTTFLRQGGRSHIEHSIRSLWLKRSNREKIQTSRNQSGPSRANLFSSVPLALSPFVSLKSRRRGGRTTVKVAHMAQSRGERKSCRALANALRENSAVSQPLSARLRRQLESLTGGMNPNANGSNAIQTQKEARDNVHRQALRALPPSWRLILLHFFCLLFAVFRH